MDLVVYLAAVGVFCLGVFLTLKTGGMLYVLVTNMFTLYVAASLLAAPTMGSILNGVASFASADTQLLALGLFIVTITGDLVLIKENKSNPGYP